MANLNLKNLKLIKMKYVLKLKITPLDQIES